MLKFSEILIFLKRDIKKARIGDTSTLFLFDSHGLQLRAKEKYPSVQRYYNIEVSTDNTTQNATNLRWSKDAEKYAQKLDEMGIYFLRTNLNMQDEVIIWNVYNTIREIENTFRTLKTDLDLRPIYHKTDKAAVAHLHMGLLAYWLVNTLRHQLNRNLVGFYVLYFQSNFPHQILCVGGKFV